MTFYGQIFHFVRAPIQFLVLIFTKIFTTTLFIKGTFFCVFSLVVLFFRRCIVYLYLYLSCCTLSTYLVPLPVPVPVSRWPNRYFWCRLGPSTGADSAPKVSAPKPYCGIGNFDVGSVTVESQPASALKMPIRNLSCRCLLPLRLKRHFGC